VKRGGSPVKRVCFIAYTDYFSDPRVRREAEALARTGKEVDVICLRGCGRGRLDSLAGVRVSALCIGRYRGEAMIWFIVGYACFFMLAMMRLCFMQVVRPYQVVQVHNIPDFLVFAAWLPKLLGAKVFLDIRDPMPESLMVKYGLRDEHPLVSLVKLEERISARFSDTIICATKEQRGLLEGRGLPPSNMIVMMNLPDEEVFGGPIGNGRRRARPEIVFHGTLAERMGVDLAVEAVGIVREEIPDILFRIYGGGELLPRLREVTEEYGLGEHVFLSGRFHPVQEIPGLIRSAFAGIVPNRRNRATDMMLPVKLLEYVALDIPVIAPRLPTIMSYFSEEMISYFDPGEVDDLARVILEVYENPAMARRKARNAATFLRHHNWKMERNRYLAIFDGGEGHRVWDLEVSADRGEPAGLDGK